jgi:hypothetical protein
MYIPIRVIDASSRLHRDVSPTTPSGGVFGPGFLSESSTLLVGDSPGQPGGALRQRRATGRGATAPAVDRRRRRGRSPSHRIRAGHSLRGSIIMVRNISALGNGGFLNEVMKPEQRRRKLILGQFTRHSMRGSIIPGDAADAAAGGDLRVTSESCPSAHLLQISESHPRRSPSHLRVKRVDWRYFKFPPPAAAGGDLRVRRRDARLLTPALTHASTPSYTPPTPPPPPPRHRVGVGGWVGGA